MTGNTRPTSVGREIFLRFLKKPPLVVVTKVLTADTISIGAVSFRQKTAFLPSERETAPQNIGPNGYAKGDDESMRKIVLDMLTIPNLKRKPDIIDEGNKIVAAFFCRYLICLAC